MIMGKGYQWFERSDKFWTREQFERVIARCKERALTDKNVRFVKDLFIEEEFTYDSFNTAMGREKKKYPYLQQLWDKVKEILESRTLRDGLVETTNASMTKFHLINNYGYSDKKAVEHSGKLTLEEFLDGLPDEEDEEGEEG